VTAICRVEGRWRSALICD